MRYGFEPITVEALGGPVIMTFGGDRETFDFEDPQNWLRIDDGVWTFAPTR